MRTNVRNLLHWRPLMIDKSNSRFNRRISFSQRSLSDWFFIHCVVAYNWRLTTNFSLFVYNWQLLNDFSFLNMRNCNFGRHLRQMSGSLSFNKNFNVLLGKTSVTSFITILRHICLVISDPSDRFKSTHVWRRGRTVFIFSLSMD